MGKRRGRGEGSIYRRGDLWVGSITVGYTAGGKRRRHVVYGATKAEVLERLTRLRHAALTNTLGDPQRLTVVAFLGHWLEDAARPAVRMATYRLYEGLIRLHVTPHIGGIRLDRLTTAHLQGLLADLERKGVRTPTRQVVFRCLHRALRQAVEWGMLPRNPAEAVVRPRGAAKEMQTLATDQARRFLDAARADRFHALYCVLLGCGLRLGEALGLTWPDVDLEAKRVHIRQQLCEVGGTLWLAEPKTARGRRTVDLPPFVADALREHQERVRAAGTLVNDRLLVFTDTAAQPVRRSNLRRRSFAPLLRRAGLPRIRLHDLRHTAATLHLRSGTHPRVVQEMLGHATISITLGTYSHVLPSMQREAAVKFDAFLSSGEAS